MDLEWIGEDDKNTLGHVSKMHLEGKIISSPHHAMTSKDYGIVDRVKRSRELKNNNLVVSGELLNFTTFKGVGSDAEITDSLFDRMKKRMVKEKVNVVHTRIPEAFTVGDRISPVNRISELQTSALVGIQLDAEASIILPPLGAGISSFESFKTIYDRTKTELQTYKSNKEIAGYIPSTNQLDIVRKIIEAYLKDGIKLFFVDFSGSSINRALIRTVVSSIRSSLKIKRKVVDQPDKQYYLHVLDVATSRKSTMGVAPIMDVLTHTYGVDSTSGVVWGGGKLEKEKLRYFHYEKYGAYRIGDIQNSIAIPPQLIEGSTYAVYDKLRADRLIEYANECLQISSYISEGEKDYGGYLKAKSVASKDVTNAMSDVKEIKANSK